MPYKYEDWHPNVHDVVNLQKAALGQKPLSPDQLTRYGVTGTPTVHDVNRIQKLALQQPGSVSPQVAQQRSAFEYSPYQQSPKPSGMMSLEEMMDVINRRVDLSTKRPIKSLQQSLEKQELQGEQHKRDIGSYYDQARGHSSARGLTEQQAGARTMAARNTYDSGMAHELANRISQRTMHMGLQLDAEEARALASVSEYLALQRDHTEEQIQDIMGEAALMAQVLLDDMHMRQQDRGDMLNQREFENWLAEEGLRFQADQMKMDEYWRAEGFDSDQAHRDWQQWFTEQEAKWNRIFSMNQFEAAQELERMAMNNQISQQEFENALKLDQFDLQVKLYEWQSRA